MKRQQGHALLLAMVVAVVMMMALAVLGLSMKMDLEDVRREARTVSLVALTDAAMAETLAHLAEDDGFGGVQEHPFGGGLVSSSVRSLGSRRLEIVAHAVYGGQRRTISAEVRLTNTGPQVLSLR